MRSSAETNREAARWLALASGAGLAISVGLLPWVRVTGTLVGGKDVTFWELRRGLVDLDGLWSLLGVPYVLIVLAIGCVLVIRECLGLGQTCGYVADKSDRLVFCGAAATPTIWTVLVIFQINEDISRANRLGLGETVNFHVGAGAWAALVCSIGLLAAAYISPMTMQAPGAGTMGAPADQRAMSSVWPPVAPGPFSNAPRLVSAKSTPGWYVDPLGRHEQRYWDRRWTEHVCDGTTQSTDPPSPSRSVTGGHPSSRPVNAVSVPVASIGPSATPSALPPARSRGGSEWYADPLGRHEQRLWDRGWTEHVRDGTTQTTDPCQHLKPRDDLPSEDEAS